ncbi:tRNA-His guanylyltransferase [Leucoagaricus gongylophorus]
MANTKYAYVRNFELPDSLLPDTFLVLRLDGHSFHRFSDAHNFAKPNDVRALELMDHAARDTMELYPDIVLAFGESDEYSFLLKKSTTIYNRRHSKIVSMLTSQFTSSYVFHWSRYFPETLLQYPPSFDGRIICYPTEKVVKDYFSWRQADTHVNNLYNTTFWALVQQGGKTTAEAHATLHGTFSKDKNEVLFSCFNINYNTIHPRFRKGSILVREDVVNEGQPFEGLDIRPSDERIIQPISPDQMMPSCPEVASDTPSTSIQLLHCGPNETNRHIVAHDSFSAPVSRNMSRSFHMPLNQAEDQHSSISADIDTLIDSTICAHQSSAHLAPTSNQELTRTYDKLKLKDKTKSKSKAKSKKKMTRIVLLHCDIIQDEFWSSRPELLSE